MLVRRRKKYDAQMLNADCRQWTAGMRQIANVFWNIFQALHRFINRATNLEVGRKFQTFPVDY